LLIIRDLLSGPRRFVELQRTLPGISTEQLRSRLNRMVADGLLTRQRYREVPPRVDYELTERSRDLAPVIGAVARWGYDWTWSAPREGEEINIGAIFRSAPGLLNPPASLKGTVEIGCESDKVWTLSIGGGTVTISEPALEGEPDARVNGSVEAWIAALGPDGDTSGLAFKGDRSLADGVLDGFMSAAASARAA
jgi:DNA-binding HxlR family transcriptional regulator